MKNRKYNDVFSLSGESISTFDRGFLSNIESEHPKIASDDITQSGGSAEAERDILQFGEA